MDRRRAAGALLALAVCITSSDAAPTASNQTTLDLYDGAAEGCYYNFQHYGEGDRIMTNEPCLNCTCHNRMLMCYLRVCPFTKPIGQDCTVEKRADQCCPIVTCPDVPVDLLTSTPTTSPAEYGATGVGKLDKYGCNINGKYFPEGSKVPPNPNNSCEHCYCIRNMTTCVMQECTLHVDGCTPIYHKAVCCPVRYSCDHPEDEMLLLDDMTTTVRPTPGFLLTTTTLSPVTQMSQDCVHEDRIVTDGALIKTEKACEHCYCMKGDIVCVVQECGTPMENEGKNCTSQPPREGQCCPDTYICEGDEIATELASVITTEPTILEEITTLSPPRRIGVEGSGYRKESEESYTEVTPFETDTEGSGYDHEIGPIIDTSDTDEKQTPEITSDTTEDILYITTSAKTPSLEEIEKTTEPDKGLNTVPSGLFDEESHETSMTQRTTLSEEIHLTEPTLVTEDKKDEIEDKTIVPEITSTEMIHKHDEILTTTESTIKTEDKKDEFEDKTIIPEITSSEMLDKHNEIVTTTEPTIITEDKKDEFEDKTMRPEITASEMIDKHDEILITTEPTVRIEDENNEVTDLAGHTEGDKISTTQNQPTESSTPQSEHDISEIETKSPSIDESEVKVTTEVYTTKYELPVDKETSKQPFDEITSAETIKPSGEVTIGETVKYDEATTPSVLEASKKDTTKSDESTEDIVKQKEITTESLLEVITSSNKPYFNEEVDTTEENIVTTQSSLALSTSTKAIEPTVEVSEDVTLKEEKEFTTELPLEVSTQAEPAGPSDDDNLDKATKEKETATKASLESMTSTEGTKLLVEVTSSSTMQQKDATTEAALETSSNALASDTPDETGEEHVIKDKDITTEPSLLSSISDKVTESLELPTTPVTGGMDEIISTTEKTSILETTSIDNKENEVEDFARIPGEGDCLVNSVTYRNNSDVPSTNNCHTSCRCVSSIVKCDPIICSPPPEYMDNCQPIYDSPDSCCPTYICHSGETMPPQPDSHMSGTEKPVTSSTFECNGDQCIIKQDEQSPAPSAKPAVSECGPTSCGDDAQGYPHVPDTDKISTDCVGNECLPSTEVCTNGNCQEALPAKPCEGEKCDKPTVSECGATSCGDDAQGYPHVPDTDKISTDCDGNECLPSTEVCTNGNCQGALPAKPCEGDKCDIEPVIIPVKNIPLCENENDCKPQVVPCEGNECVQVDCNTSDCGATAVSPSIENEQNPEACTDKDNCQKQEDEAKLPCSDDLCRRKETEVLENQLPIDCSGSDCEKQKPDVVEKVDIQTEMPIKVPERVTETIPEEPSSKYPQPAEELPVEKYGETPSAETHSTTIMESSEQSTPKSDLVDESFSIDTTTMPETLGSSIATESSLTTESEKIMHFEPTPQSVDITTSVHLSVTESQLSKETTQTEEEFMKPTVASPEISDQTSEYPEEQTSIKPSDAPVAVDEEMVTDRSVATQLPEASEVPTESQKTSVTESQPTTESRLDVEAVTLGETKPEDTKDTDKKILELPEYPTTEPQQDIRTTEATTAYKTEEVTIKTQEEEKETVTAATIQESDKSTTKPEVSIAETSESSTQSQVTVIQEATQKSAYEPSDESSSAKPHDTMDLTTAESPQRFDTDKTESNEIAEKTTSIPEKPKITESEYEITPTEATKTDQSTAHEDIESTSKPELPDILSMTPAIQEETKAPFTNKPSVPYEDKTTVPDIPVTEENIVTLKPDIDTTEKQQESEASDIPVTISYETVTASKEILPPKQDDIETKSDSPVTDEPVKETETTKSEVTSEVATESSITKQDVQTESSPAVPTTSTAEKTSSISQALSTESDIEFTKSPKQDQVTDMPVQSSSTYEPNKEETSEKESVSEIPEKYTTLIDNIGTEKPLSETTEFEPVVTESSTSILMKESTEPQLTSVPEEVKPTDHTDELPQVTDKIKEEEDIPSERPGLSQQEETFTSTQKPEEPFKTTSVPKFTQESATEKGQQDSQTTITEYHQEKEGSTEPSVQTYTEPQEVEEKTPSIDVVTPSSEVPATELQSSKEPVDYSVTESELSTETPGQFVTKEKGTTASEKLFTTEGSELFHTTKSDEHFTKLYPEEETLTEIPVIVTEQQKDTETTDASESGPKIKEQETKEPGLTTIAPLVTGAESILTQPAVTSFETSKSSTESSVTESTVSLSTNIPESHIRDEEQTLTVTTFTNVPTNALQEEQTQTPHPTVSELQTEELLEVTDKPQSLPQAITTLSVPETTEDIHKEIVTDSLIEATTASILEEASQLPQDIVTEKTDEMLTRAPQDMATEVPQVEITTKLTDHTSVELQTETEAAVKETSTEKLQEPSVTDTMIDIEKSTLKSDEPVTETNQDVITKAIQETAEEELKTTHSPIDLTTKSEILREGDVTKESETSATPIPQEKTTAAAGETISEIQPTVTTTIPETIDTKHDETSETLPGLSTSLPEEMITANVPDTEASTKIAETSTKLTDYEITKPEVKETSEPKYDITETTPYVVELEEHTHKAVEETSTMVSDDLEAITKPTESHVEMSTEKESATVEVEPTEHEKDQSTSNLPVDDESKLSDEDLEKSTPMPLSPTDELTTQSTIAAEIPTEKQDEIPHIHTQPHDDVSSTSERETEISLQTEKTPSTDLSPEITMPEEEIQPATSKATTTNIEEYITTSSPVFKPEAKPSETLPPTATAETPKPGLNEVLPTDEMPDDDGHFPPSGGSSGYGQEPDYVEEDQAFGPGTCRYGGKVYVSAQQIPRDDPCDFCFCFRSDIICLQQSCPPPIHGCHEEPIQGFCCPRYECPVAMATSLNVTTTTTTTTTTLPPHFLPHAYKGAAQRRGCQIKGHTYKVGEVVRASSGPCLHCTCGGDGQMKCDPKACTPEPMLRQMIAAAVSAKRRR